MNFSFDIVDGSEIFASIVTSQSLKAQVSDSTQESDNSSTAVHNLDDSNVALARVFPTITAKFDLHDTVTLLHVIRGLGEGTMGRVFLTRDSRTSKVLALKVFNKRHVLACEELEHTVTERDCLAETRDNPFTTNFRASFQDETRLYMLLDFCAGGDLATELTRWKGKLPMGSVMYNAAHLLEGIASLHALGIVHRDLKPENILLTIRGHIKISDFGSAIRVVSPESWVESSPPFGTAAYLPPEVIAGFSHNSAVDWWCLGIIIYEMVVGEHPFLPEYARGEKMDMEDLQEAICNGEYLLPETMEPSIRRIIRGLLRIDPERRYSAAKARKSIFFAGWDWDLVRELKYQPPHPPVLNAHDATSNFDPEFINMSFEDPDINEAMSPLDGPYVFPGFAPALTGAAIIEKELTTSAETHHNTPTSLERRGMPLK